MGAGKRAETKGSTVPGRKSGSWDCLPVRGSCRRFVCPPAQPRPAYLTGHAVSHTVLAARHSLAALRKRLRSATARLGKPGAAAQSSFHLHGIERAGVSGREDQKE